MDGYVNANNYVNRDAVLYYVKSHIHEIITESGIDKNDHTNRVLRAIVNGIKTMPPCEGNNGWIPCSERLPERDINVLAYHRNISFDYQYVSWIDDYSGRWCGFIGNLSDDVVAWMPLPEPYKKEGE